MQYNIMASPETVNKTVRALREKSIEVFVLDNEAQALEKIKKLIPKRATVMNGSSRTLEEIGFIDYLKSGNHPWNNLHTAIVAEEDQVKQAALRKQATLSDYYLGSVHALSETGEFIVASNTGSQLSHIVYSSQNLIFVVGSQKIVPTLMEGMKRLEWYVIPMEDENMKQKYGVGTALNKLLIFKGESPFNGRKVSLILVNKVLGF